jgi:hypothetical protein
MTMKAKTRTPHPQYASKTEAEYAAVLHARYIIGEIQSYMYSPIKLRLADNTTYTPDFFVVNKEGYIEMHEVKGFWRDDARVKIKVAANIYTWFTFVVVQKKGKQFVVTEMFNE